MKAEERKELETNTLADRMGKIVQSVKGGPNRRTVFWVIIVAVVILAIFLYMRNRARRQNQEAQNWFVFGNARVGSTPDQRLLALQQTARSVKGPAGEAAAMSFNWLRSHHGAIMMVYDLRERPLLRFRELEGLSKEMEELRTRAKDQPILQAEALYHLCVLTETRSLLDHVKDVKLTKESWEEIDPQGKRGSFLKTAKELYDELSTKHKNTPYAELATKRLEVLADETGYQSVQADYEELARQLHLEDTLRGADIMEMERRRRAKAKGED